MADEPPSAPSIRDPRPDDQAAWRHLWAGYVDFYEAAVSEAVTRETWRRLLDPSSDMFGRLAELDDTLAGFTVSVLHEGSWTLTPACYLEDLYVDPSFRKRRVARALIDDLLALARARGWSRLYWHTKASNEAARRLYDTYTQADGFVRYRLLLA